VREGRFVILLGHMYRMGQRCSYAGGASASYGEEVLSAGGAGL
jgi:hypothetical protein